MPEIQPVISRLVVSHADHWTMGRSFIIIIIIIIIII